MQSEVMAMMAAKRAEMEARVAELDRERQAMEAQLATLDTGSQTAKEALATLEQLVLDTPKELLGDLLKTLIKTCEQDAKRNGISLFAEVTAGSNNGKAPTESNGKKTRNSTVSLDEPEEFTVFPNNKRLAVDGLVNDNSVRYSKVYIGVDAVRTTPASAGSARVWKEWLIENDYTSQVKVGSFFAKASLAGLEGNYILELSEVPLRDLSRLIDIDFGQTPTSEDNEARMSREYTELVLADEDEPTSEPEPSEDEQIIQHEEIREAEPVEVVPNAPVQDLYPVGTKFQLVGVSGFDGNYGEVTAVNPDKLTPYVCTVDGFSIPLELRHNQLDVIPEDETVEEELELKDIPF